jgi:hypothetical protein
MTLRLPCYDTQCGAKLFRATDVVRDAFREPFISRWIFDVEIIARLVVDGDVDGRSGIYEFPLVRWEDAPGSKIGPSTWWIALLDLWRSPIGVLRPLIRSTVTRIQNAYDVLFAGYYHRIVISVLAIVIAATASARLRAGE